MEKEIDAKSKAWVDQAAGLPVDTSTFNDDGSEFNYTETTNTTNESPQNGFRPVLIIVLTFLSLILFIGVMIWSIFTVKEKKKNLVTNASEKETQTGFKLLDSIEIENGKTLHLIELQERQFLLASAWGSVNLITEMHESTSAKAAQQQAALDKREAEILEMNEEIQSSLDFMTIQAEENSEADIVGNLFEKIEQKEERENSPQAQTQHLSSNNIQRIINDNHEKNKIDKAQNTYFKINNSSAQEKNNNSEDESAMAEFNAAEKKLRDSFLHGQIKRSYSPEQKNESLNTFKKPSWLRDRENKYSKADELSPPALNDKMPKQLSSRQAAIKGEEKQLDSSIKGDIVSQALISGNAQKSSTTPAKISRKISIVEE